MKKTRIDQPEIIYPTSPEHPWIRGKRVCMSLVDWTLFGDALTECLPNAVYVRDTTPAEAAGSNRPEIYAEKHLCAARAPDPDRPGETRFPGEITMYLDPKAEVSVTKNPRWQSWAGLSWPRIRFLPRAGVWPANALGPEHLEEGEIQVYVEPHNKGHARFMRQIFRLLTRFTTNEKLPLVSYPHYEFRRMGDALFSIYIGYDALRWARENPKRLLAYDLSALSRRTPDYLGAGFRPRDDVGEGLLNQ
jgi:hypothetical protein